MSFYGVSTHAIHIWVTTQRFSVSIRCVLEQDVKQSNWLMPAANKRGNSLVDETSTCIFETRELEYRRDYLRTEKKVRRST